MRTFVPIVALFLAACAAKTQPDTATPVAEPTVAEPEKAPVDPIPAMFGALTPQLVVDDVDAAVTFYAAAFGGQELFRMGPAGEAMHAEVKIGDSVMMIDRANEMMKSPTTLGGTPVTLFLYVPDADASWATAVAAGATEVMPLEDQFWGDRFGEVSDPFGHRWGIGSHIEDLTEEQMAQRSEIVMAEFAKAAKKKPAKDKKGKKGKAKRPPKWKEIEATAATDKVPPGYQSITPMITVQSTAAVLAFYKTVFGATERNVMQLPDGMYMHAEAMIGDHVLMLSDEMSPERKAAQGLGGSPVIIHHYTKSSDDVFAKATAGGAQTLMPMADVPWGDHYGLVLAPDGLAWGIATHIEDVPPEEINRRMSEQAGTAAPAADAPAEAPADAAPAAAAPADAAPAAAKAPPPAPTP